MAHSDKSLSESRAGCFIRKRNPSLIRRIVVKFLFRENKFQLRKNLPNSFTKSTEIISCLLSQPKPDRIRLLPVALSTLLALDALTSTLGGVGGVLGLVSLLLALGSGLLLLALLDGLLAGGGTGLGALGAALLDNVEGGTDNGTLGLHDTAGTLLGNFLFTLKNSSVSTPSCVVSNASKNPFRCPCRIFHVLLSPSVFPVSPFSFRNQSTNNN